MSVKSSDPKFDRARELCLSYWKEMRRLRKVVLKQWGSEDIHDLRVASRRFRSVLNLFRPMCNCKGIRRLVKEVRGITGALGTLRNLDEAVVFFESHGQGIDVTGLISHLQRLRVHEQRKVSRSLGDFKPGKSDRVVRKMIAGVTVEKFSELKAPPLPAYLSDVSIMLFDTVQAHLPAALSFENHEERHELRISIKKWRYFMEIVSQILDRDFDATLATLKKYQSLLGSMNDLSVFSELSSRAKNSADVQSAVEQLIAVEHKKLFQEFTALATAEPLTYTFKV